jgi:hypothetical protein
MPITQSLNSKANVKKNTTMIYSDALDIITPIHSTKSNVNSDLQSTLPVGSQGISDNRKFTPLRDALPAAKAWAQAVGITTTPSTSSTTLIPATDMSVSIKTNGGPIEISYNISASNNSASVSTNFQIYVDGAAVGTVKTIDQPVSSGGYSLSVGDCLVVPVSAGVHKVDVYWSVSGGTANLLGIKRTLNVREI